MKNKLINLNKYKTSKGYLYKYVDNKSNFFNKFGEVYFNLINKNKKSDWIFHKKNRCLLTVINGKIKFEFFSKENKIQNVTLSRKKNYKLLILPKKTWFRFIGLESNSILVNLIDNRHQDQEVIKKDVL